jgi:hypothetical protein
MASETKTPSVTIQPDTLVYAKERGVAEHLPAVLEMTRRVFPDARTVEVTVEDDVTNTGPRFLIVTVFIPKDWGESRSYYLTYEQWEEALFQICPARQAAEFGFNLMGAAE